MQFSENGFFHFVAFINGGSFGFQTFWAEAKSGVREKAAVTLRKRRVVDEFGRVDVHAVDEVESLVLEKLLTLAKRPGKAAFDHDRAGHAPAGLARWLNRIVANCVIDYCRQFHGARKGVKHVSLTGLTLNALGRLSAGDEKLVEKLSRLEQLERVRQALNRLSARDRFVLEQTIVHDVRQRDLAKMLGTSPAGACRSVKRAKANLQKLLAA
jgi:RNA polymerase sigma factor (sigma-70 family)